MYPKETRREKVKRITRQQLDNVKDCVCMDFLLILVLIVALVVYCL